MRLSAPPSVLFFASAAHGLHHILLALYLTLVLVITPAWHLPYNDMIALWTFGAMLVGLGAPVSGWMADRFGETKMLILCFVGLGAASVLCGLAQTPLQLEAALALLGLSGSIYHPVGFSWVVKHARVRGRAIAATGIAGSIGVALGPVTAAGLAWLWGWRAAFAMPGLVALAAGLCLFLLHIGGRIVDRAEDTVPLPQAIPSMDRMRVFAVLSVSMTATLLLNSAFLTALPKLVQLSGVASVTGLLGIGIIAGGIQLLGASGQFAGGRLADLGLAKRAYIAGFVALAVALPWLGLASGWMVPAVGVLTVLLFESMAPMETMLLAYYAPAARRGAVFGLRYGLSAVGTPAGVWFVSHFYNPAVHFRLLMVALAITAILGAAAAFFLPSQRTAAFQAAE